MDLIQRRLNTLIKLLRAEASTQAYKLRVLDSELTAKEMRDWANQCEVIANQRNPTDPLLR